jgi:hypothetical protein
VLKVTGNQLGWYPEGISADLATAGPIIDRNLSDYAAKFTAILGRGVSEDEIVHRLIQSKATTTCPPPMVFANGGLLFSWRKAGTNEAACGGDPSQPAAVSSDGQSIVGTY